MRPKPRASAPAKTRPVGAVIWTSCFLDAGSSQRATLLPFPILMSRRLPPNYERETP